MGAPEGSVLSIKVGDTKRQAPVSRVGQPFRFGTSLAEPLPLTVELLAPVAPAQVLNLGPATHKFVVDFGGQVKVRLQQREAQELQKPPVNISAVASDIAASRSVPQQKLDMAQNAAAYLQEHDLVRIFQDILHGLLVSKPKDPFAYVEAHFQRAKILDKIRQGIDLSEEEKTFTQLPAMPTSPTSPFSPKVPPAPPPTAAQRAPPTAAEQPARPPAYEEVTLPGAPEPPTHSTRRGQRAEALLGLLQYTRKSLTLIVPFLPEELVNHITDEDFSMQCANMFNDLDRNADGTLQMSELPPLICKLSESRKRDVSEEQCLRLIEQFDMNNDGTMQADEFGWLVTYVLIATYLESPEGQELIDTINAHKDAMADWFQMLREDKAMLDHVIPLLPDSIGDHLISEEFIATCMEQYDRLDTDGSGQLEPSEIVPVIAAFGDINPVSISLEDCADFVNIFDSNQDGVIKRKEFLHLTQFVLVLGFLKTTETGKQVGEAAVERAIGSVRAQRLLSMLEDDWRRLPEVIPLLKQEVVEELVSEDFVKVCMDGFDDLDENKNGMLDPVELCPFLLTLCSNHPITITEDECIRFLQIFDKDKNGVIQKDEFVSLGQFVVIMGYLNDAEGYKKIVPREDRQNIEDMLKALKEGAERLDDVLAFLPDDFKTFLLDKDFTNLCLVEFDSLDQDGNSQLDYTELLPVLSKMSTVRVSSITDEQSKRFVELFDIDGSGMISREEFVTFARFMLIMAFLETDEGQVVADNAELALGKRRVEELLVMLEQDRDAVHKAVPLLPKEVFEHLSSGEFVMQCRDRFADLDKDNNGCLDPAELFPVVVELSAAHPMSIDYEQCRRFTSLFDIHGNGVIMLGEFVDFARFLSIMCFLHSKEGKERVSEGLQIMEDAMKIDELLVMLKRDKRELHSVLPYLPPWLKDELLSDAFTLNCLDRFAELDQDNSGALDPTELFDAIIEMTNAHTRALDLDQCRRFTAIFDDSGVGTIDQKEFVNFARFLMVMGFLQTEDGSALLRRIHQEEQAPTAEHAPDPAPQSADLATENEALRHRMGDLERMVQLMEQRLSDQEARYQAAVQTVADGS